MLRDLIQGRITLQKDLGVGWGLCGLYNITRVASGDSLALYCLTSFLVSTTYCSTTVQI